MNKFDLSGIKLVEETVNRIHECCVKNLMDEIAKCIIEFYEKCPIECLRSAIMDLIVKTHKSISPIKDSSSIIKEILLQFEKFMENQDEKFVNDFVNQDVSQNAWEKSFKIAVYQDVSKCSTAFDLIFHIRKPESEKRENLIKFHVGKLLEKENTVNNGKEWSKIFDIKLEQESSDKKSLNISQKFDDNVSQMDTVTEKCSKLNPVFEFSSYTKEILRNETMKWIIQMSELISKMEIKNPASIIQKIYLGFEEFLRDKNEEFVKDVLAAAVLDDLWESAWNICFEAAFRNIRKSWFALNLLFRIHQPESESRYLILEKSVRKLLDQNETFKRGSEWISPLNLVKLKDEYFKKLVFNPLIFRKKRTKKIFIHQNDQFRCLQLLDSFLIRVHCNQLQTQEETNFLEKITLEKLPAKICKLANIYGFAEFNFYAFRASFIQNVKVMYNFIDRNYFELYVLDALKGKSLIYFLDFLHVISDDPKYAYCWAKFFQIHPLNMPLFLQNCQHYDSDAFYFIQRIAQKINVPVDRDQIEICKFWKKPYQMITVLTPEALNNFIANYMIKSKVIGIDCEAQPYHLEVAVLQLASHNWICLIDIQELSDQLSEEEWIDFFEKLFDPKIIRIGFSFQNDYGFLCKRFPFLQPLFLEQQRKVLCLQNLMRILISKQDGIFNGKLPKSQGLAALSKSILNIDLDKSLQMSDWANRPLTQLQKIYAVSDALIVVLIKDEIEKRLKEQVGDIFAAELMEEGCIVHVVKEKKQRKKLNCC